MARKNRDVVFDHLIGSEGKKYTNRNLADDPGGPTKYGVTLADLRLWRRNKELQANDVKNLGIGEAKEIFFHRYWDEVKGDELPSGLDYAVSDFAYHSGPGRALEYLQRQLGVNVDRVISLKTLAACAAIQDVDAFIDAYQDARLAYCKRLPNWRPNRNGWTTRIDVEVRNISKELAGDYPPPYAPGPVASAQGAALVRSPLKASGETTTVGLMGSTATDMAQQLAPHVDTLAIVKYIFIALTLIGVVAGLYLTAQRMKGEA